MQLDRSIISELQGVPWLQNCGNDQPKELEDIQKATDEIHALSLLASDNWADARTEAQGDLTSYLSKHHYNAYGGYWNNLAKEATKLIENVALEPIKSELKRREWPEDLSKSMIVDLTRAVLEVSYRTKFKKAPAFFGCILEIYRMGHLPCGWSGKMTKWPEGVVIAY
jgi:hypothetical protein